MLKEKRANFKKIWESLPETNQLTIKHLQRKRRITEGNIHHAVRCLNRNLIHTYKKIWIELNEELQDIWGLDRDHEMHRFWEIPGCICPAQDNEERYGWGRGQIIASGCPIHGIEQGDWEGERET